MGAATLASSILVAACVAAVGGVGGWYLGRRVRWAPAAPLALLAATPLVPHMPIALGFSTDDVLPGLAILLAFRAVPWHSWRSVRVSALVVVGTAIAAAAGVISSLANATDAPDLVQMLLRSAGHLAFLGLIAMTVALARPAERRRDFVATALAAVGTFEAAFGLLAWLLPLPGGAGVEASRQQTVLYGKVSGRISGTTGLSPDFLGAIFVLTIPLTVALALEAHDRSRRLLWWGAAVLQVAALALTFTRTSLVIGLVALAAMLVSRQAIGRLAALGLFVGILAVVTPLGSRLVGDANDRLALWTSAATMTADHPITGVGPGKSLAVAAADPAHYRTTAFGVATSSAHNAVLLAGAETGILGAIGVALLLLGVGWVAVATIGGHRLPRAAKVPMLPGIAGRAAALGLLGLLVQAMTNNLLTVQVTSVLATLVFAGFFVPERHDREATK